MRRALYDRLSAPRRAELHLRVGEALEADRRALRSRARRPRAPLRRRRAVRRDRARGRVQRARGARGGAALAFDEAAARLRTALELGIDGPDERAARPRSSSATRATAPATRSTRWRRSRRPPRSRASSANAQLLARAAIGYEEACWRPGIADQGAIELLEEAVAALGEEDSELRVGLLSGLARALDFQGQRERGAVVRTSAIAMARRLDDRAGLASVLDALVLVARHDARSTRSSRC